MFKFCFISYYIVYRHTPRGLYNACACVHDIADYKTFSGHISIVHMYPNSGYELGYGSTSI